MDWADWNEDSADSWNVGFPLMPGWKDEGLFEAVGVANLSIDHEKMKLVYFVVALAPSMVLPVAAVNYAPIPEFVQQLLAFASLGVAAPFAPAPFVSGLVVVESSFQLKIRTLTLW